MPFAQSATLSKHPAGIQNLLLTPTLPNHESIFPPSTDTVYRFSSVHGILSIGSRYGHAEGAVQID